MPTIGKDTGTVGLSWDRWAAGFFGVAIYFVLPVLMLLHLVQPRIPEEPFWDPLARDLNGKRAISSRRGLVARVRKLSAHRRPPSNNCHLFGCHILYSLDLKMLDASVIPSGFN